jgi:ABC-type lipoprotein export system ATPase subunit
MLLDEPTASLDPARREAVLGLLADLKRSGTALILVLHDPIQPTLVDRSLVLREGSA